MEFLWELLVETVGKFLYVACFLTGEVLIKAATLGTHRMRWWEQQDFNVN